MRSSIRLPPCLAQVGRAIRITKDVRLIGGVPATLPLGKDLVFRSTRAFVLVSVRYPDGIVTDLSDWILPGESSGGKATARVVFSDTPRPDDPELLKKIGHTELFEQSGLKSARPKLVYSGRRGRRSK